MKWRAFQYNKQVYDLSHMHPFSMVIMQPAKGSQPECTYKFDVKFSLHCFAKKLVTGDDPSLAYGDNRETRTFCFDRYRLSQHLPAIIRDIGSKRCNHTGKGNFFIIELVDDDGTSVEYEVYFNITKPATGKKKPMQLFVQSAYVRDAASKQYRHKAKKISFYVIAFNKKTGKPIRTPR